MTILGSIILIKEKIFCKKSVRLKDRKIDQQKKRH